MHHGTRFTLLGPLAAQRFGAELPLGGARQRATLGYLLLYPNQVVPTSRLITALWGDSAPVSARKVLQNTVWRLRRLFEADERREKAARTHVELLTRAPGYLLRVAPEQIDLHRFRNLAAEGRQELDAGSPEAASRLWREALTLWRGPVLADLVEDGIAWPELKAIANARLDLLEDHFDNELALGRHEAILAELQTTARGEPRRERLLGQLMLTLYRCGRHTEALDTFDRARLALIEELGLEPGHELRDLRQSIVTHDPALLYAPRARAAGPAPVPGPPGAASPGADGLGFAGAVLAAMTADAESRGKAAGPPGAGERAGAVPGRRDDGPVTERKEVTAVLVRVAFASRTEYADPEDIESAAERADGAIRFEVARFGGVPAGRMGSLWVAVFGARRSMDDDPVRAVSAALAIRHHIESSSGMVPGATVRAAVATGPALVRDRPGTGSAPRVTGALLDQCHSMLPLVPAHEVWAADETRRQSSGTIAYRRARAASHVSAATGILPPGGAPHTGALLGRERELANVVELFRAGKRPSPALLVGDAGMGKTRIIDEFERILRAPADGGTGPLVVRLPPRLVDGSLLPLIADGLGELCGITAEHTPEEARELLWEAVRGAVRTDRDGEWMLARLTAAFGTVPDFGGPTDLDAVVTAWWRLLEHTALERQVAVLIDDLHTADDTILEMVGRHIIPTTASELFVLATARPELADRRSLYTADERNVTTVAVGRLPDGLIERRVRLLLDEQGLASCAPDADEAAAETRALLVSLADGNPLLAAEFVAALAQGVRDELPQGTGPEPHDLAARLLPSTVRRVIAARLDRLPDYARTMLRDAAIVGDTVWPGAVAAAAQRDRAETEAALEMLAHHGLLSRVEGATVRGEVQYVFRYGPVRHVAYTRVPRAARAATQARISQWLETQEDPDALRRLTAAGPASRELVRLAALTERLRIRERGGGRGGTGT
ncbi:BTAD domain-containing putative transcriptional regulator [Yinghuangia soli]|uniref:AAA family ATPase n=1 Tax=Yinghuangia soli TaxID=2908204 RepID=A0AA41Q0R5_9ACTN|nr:BTAD domain-containing putative transcriptional regulator [Yinghuangia soli]MCF2528845.1 AAA family ATPase [Yinghuangia soli]